MMSTPADVSSASREDLHLHTKDKERPAFDYRKWIPNVLLVVLIAAIIVAITLFSKNIIHCREYVVERGAHDYRLDNSDDISRLLVVLPTQEVNQYFPQLPVMFDQKCDNQHRGILGEKATGKLSKTMEMLMRKYSMLENAILVSIGYGANTSQAVATADFVAEDLSAHGSASSKGPFGTVGANVEVCPGNGQQLKDADVGRCLEDINLFSDWKLFNCLSNDEKSSWFHAYLTLPEDCGGVSRKALAQSSCKEWLTNMTNLCWHSDGPGEVAGLEGCEVFNRRFHYLLDAGKSSHVILVATDLQYSALRGEYGTDGWLVWEWKKDTNLRLSYQVDSVHSRRTGEVVI